MPNCKITIQKIMGSVDPAMLDAVDAFVVAYIGHRRHQTEAQVRAAICTDPAAAASYQRKIVRATILLACDFSLEASPAAKVQQ